MIVTDPHEVIDGDHLVVIALAATGDGRNDIRERGTVRRLIRQHLDLADQVGVLVRCRRLCRE